MSEKLISYKMSIDEASSKLYDYYNSVMRKFVLSDTYAVKRNQAINNIIKKFFIITLVFSPFIYEWYFSIW